MFGLFKKKEEKKVIFAYAAGEAVPVDRVPDPTFSQEILGKGMAIIPADGKIYAPCDGRIQMVFDTLHAISMVSDFGAEILIHAGLDTVTLKGNGFKAHVIEGDEVKRGQLLLEMDTEKIKAAGLDPITPLIICNSGEYSHFSLVREGSVNPGEELFIIS